LSPGGGRYTPYPQLSPTHLPYTPGYVMGTWIPPESPQQDINETYTGTGYHHLVDQPMSRQADTMRQDGSVISPSTLAQRRLYRGNSYTFGTGLPSLQSPASPREDAFYGRIAYAPLPINPQSGHSHSMSATNQTISPQFIHESPISAPSSQVTPPLSTGYITPQPSYPSRHDTSLAINPSFPVDPQLQSPHQSSPEFAVPTTRRTNSSDNASQIASSPSASSRRPKLEEASNTSSSISGMSFSSTGTQSSQSSHSFSQHDIHHGHHAGDYYSQPTESYIPYKPDARLPPRSRSESSSQRSLTPHVLADHTQIQDAIHEQHVDATKQALSLDNGNDVGVIEYLDTLPQSAPSQ
jgi:hypothetical protein